MILPNSASLLAGRHMAPALFGAIRDSPLLCSVDQISWTSGLKSPARDVPPEFANLSPTPRKVLTVSRQPDLQDW